MQIKRNATVDAIDKSFSDIDENIDFTYYSESSHDRCFKGEYNWKIKDDFTYRCSYRLTRFYGFNSDFRVKMVEFEQKINQLGWSPSATHTEGFPLKEIIETYQDTNVGIGVFQNLNTSRVISLEDLPNPGEYVKDSSLLEISYTLSNSLNPSKIERIQDVRNDTKHEIYDSKNFQNIVTVLQEISQKDSFTLTVSIQEDYYRD